MLGEYLGVSWYFEIIPVRFRPDLRNDVTALIIEAFLSYRPEIWWIEEQYHEAYCYLNGHDHTFSHIQPKFHIFYGRFGPDPRGKCEDIILQHDFGGMLQRIMKQITV